MHIPPAMRKTLYLSLTLLPFIASAQHFSVGVIGGAPAQTPLGESANKLPFVIGPTLTVGSFAGFSVQTGVLFHRLGETQQNYALRSLEGAVTLGTDTFKARAIEIPVLLRYQFLSRLSAWHPFISAGPSVRRVSIDYTGTQSVVSGNPISYSAGPSMTTSNVVKWRVDPVVGVGVSFRAGAVKIEPEVRYSYWGAGSHTVVRQNQVHFLFGIRF